MLTRSQVFEHIEICCIIGSCFCLLGAFATVGLSAFKNVIPPVQLMGLFSAGTWFFISLLYLGRAINMRSHDQSSDMEKTS